MNEYERTAQSLKARITALRSSLASGLESFKAIEIQRVVNTPQRSKEEKRVEPKVEPDWDAIAKRTAENDAKEAKDAEMVTLKAKLMGNKS
tara:strand:+ start:665 stop:937 length:273 start_codon:yes stop_codon:yes gene_type:complete